MLLETLDVGKNDIMIYSQNIFSAENNFRIIFKNNPKMTAKKISFSDVCMFISDTTPKNLIIYRLLTNLDDVGIERSKFGFSIVIDEELEVIYFDPIYAIKEIEAIVEKSNNFDIRFRIQQVGLTSSISINGKPSFTEIYSVDLASREAKFQNDKVFVEALFAVENKGFKETKDTKESLRSKTEEGEKKNEKSEVIKTKKATVISGKTNDVDSHDEKILAGTIKQKLEPPQSEVNPIKHSIVEDETFDHKQVFRMTIQRDKNVNDETSREKKIKKLKLEKSEFSKFLHQNRNESKNDESDINLIDIFKSSSSLNDFRLGRGDKKIVLKLNQ